MKPQERIAEALKEKAKGLNFTEEQLRGHLGPKREPEHVELFAGDIVESVNNLGDKADPTMKMLRQGSSAVPPDGKVTIRTDHAYLLLDQINSIQA